jgi:hypothetical protein
MAFLTINHSIGTIVINFNNITAYTQSSASILFTQIDGTILTLTFSTAGEALLNFNTITKYLNSPDLDYLHR